MLKSSFNFAAFKMYINLLDKHLLNRLKIFKSWFVKRAQKLLISLIQCKTHYVSSVPQTMEKLRQITSEKDYHQS